MLVKDLQTQSRKICITVGGGLGDQVCAEPVIRWMKKKWFKNDDIVLMTQYPQLFKHLDVQCYTENVRFSEPRLTCKTHPETNEIASDIMYIHMCHPVDYISLRLLRRQLPLSERQPHLQVDRQDQEKIRSILPTDRKDLIIVHAGIGWTSNTIPVDIWRSYIQALRNAGFQVILVGQQIIHEQGTSRGVHFNLGQVEFDLRNQLSLGELMAVIEYAPILLTNDSGPIHVAGAFNNWIGLIASAKHPDFVLPYRHGNQSFRAKSLEKYRPYENEFDFDPIEKSGVNVSDLENMTLRRVAPSAEDIVIWAEQTRRELTNQ